MYLILRTLLSDDHGDDKDIDSQYTKQVLLVGTICVFCLHHHLSVLILEIGIVTRKQKTGEERVIFSKSPALWRAAAQMVREE